MSKKAPFVSFKDQRTPLFKDCGWNIVYREDYWCRENTIKHYGSTEAPPVRGGNGSVIILLKMAC